MSFLGKQLPQQGGQDMMQQGMPQGMPPQQQQMGPEVPQALSGFLSRLGEQLQQPQFQSILGPILLANPQMAQQVAATVNQISQQVGLPPVGISQGQPQGMPPQQGQGGQMDISQYEQMDPQTKAQLLGPDFVQQFEMFKANKMSHPEMVQFIRQYGGQDG
jgi:hypothetical protein